MGNKQRGEVSFEADGNQWTMKIDTNAMCEIEDLTGKGIAEVGQLLANPKTASIKLLRSVFMGALSANHELSSKQVGELMDEIGVQRTGELVGKAFELAFPDQKKKGGASGNPQPGTTQSQTVQ